MTYAKKHMDKISINLLKSELRGDGAIEDVSKSTWNMLLDKYKVWVALCIGISIIWLATFFLLFTNSSDTNMAGLIFAALPFLFLYSVVRTQVKHEFMRQFASQLGLEYQRQAMVPNENAHFFNLGHRQKVEDYISGIKGGRPISIFNYHFTMGSSKRKRSYTYTVFNIDLPYTMPSAIIAPNNGWFSRYNGIDMTSGKHAVTLETELDKHLTLYVEPHFEVEALQIFTKEFLDQIATEWRGFYIELIDNNIYIYSNRMIQRKADMENMFALMEAIIEHTQNMLEHVSSSTEAMKLHTEPKPGL